MDSTFTHSAAYAIVTFLFEERNMYMSFIYLLLDT